MFVIGTAGHVDHGKSTLVMALTGIDPDRLQEEKARGLTIDLGFAWLELPSGREVSIVDVPGHERFIKNMLAGVGGIDLALLVIAADESVMPQTREHLAILDLLQIQHGIVVVTKKDLVDDEFLELVKVEIEEILLETVLERAPIVSVSGLTGEGLPNLLQEIDGVLEQIKQKRDIRRPRLPIDRAFTISGFGSVVTGTLIEGSLSIGQEVEFSLMGQRSRIRGLQTHRKKLDTAMPGTRVAVNLSGVDYRGIERGDVLTLPGWLKPTKAMDVRLRILQTASAAVKHNAHVNFHSGASDVPAQIRLLDKNTVQPGEEAWAQIKLETPVVVAKGDFFVVRSSVTTLGGGNIVDPYAKRHRRSHLPTLRRLEILEQGSDQDVLLETLGELGPCDLPSLLKRGNISEKELLNHLNSLFEKGLVIALGTGKLNASTILYATSSWDIFVDRLRNTLADYHQRYVLRKGVPKEEIRSRLGLSPQIFQHSLARLTSQQIVIEEGPLIRLPEHSVIPTEEQQLLMDDYVQMLLADPFSPVTDQEIASDLVILLEESGRVVRIGGDLVYEARTYKEMIARIIAHAKDNGNISVAEVRDMFNTSRKYALPLLEHLDQKHITRRVGDSRVLR